MSNRHRPLVAGVTARTLASGDGCEGDLGASSRPVFSHEAVATEMVKTDVQLDRLWLLCPV